MYETYIGLNKRPFAAVPLVDGYFPGTASENARTALTRCIERGEGIGLVVGPVGTGKTLLCQKLAEQFKKAFRVVQLTCGRLSTRRSLFQAILHQLEQPYRSMDEGELRLALVDYLTSEKDQSRGLLLLVDEAHTLPLRLLDEIRMLTNLARAGQPLVRVVLSGSGALEERLANPKLDSFNSRIASRCYLEALNRSETADYLRSKIDAAGGSGEEIFSDEACESVYRATEGVPRLINQLCDHALLVAFSAGQRRLTAANIEEAWADLQQLPTPWNGDNQVDKPGVIEFGRLDEGAEEASDESIKMPTPALRINEETQDADFTLAEPIEQIDSIKQLISGAVDNFEPLDASGPEIELTFDEFDHPFEEPFEEEEVVSDRYTAPMPVFSALQSGDPVFRFEFSKLAAAGREEDAVVRGKIEEVVEQPAVKAPAVHANSLEKDEVEVTKNTIVLGRESAVDIQRECGPMPIVEEAETITEMKSPKAVQPVPRNDYRRLFAKLRHG
jgi:type II secretory pathway predicted ATPase ExeA